MTKLRNEKRRRFPFKFERNGRTGKIYRLGNGTFKTHFVFAGDFRQNTHGTFDGAFAYLEREFTKLDTNQVDSLALHPLNGNVRGYHELEELLREQGDGASLREAVTFFLVNRKTKRLQPATVSECVTSFLDSQRTNNVSEIQIKTLAKHFRRFTTDYGPRKIHDLSALEIGIWLGSRHDKRTGAVWSTATRRKVRGSLVSLSLYSQKILNAIPDNGQTEFQKVRNPKPDQKAEVEVYTPAALEKLLLTALENDIDLIPALVVGNFAGLRPYEFHAEGLAPKRLPLKMEAFNWPDGFLNVKGQKVRSKATRDVPLHTVTLAWLSPFRKIRGQIWTYKKAYEDKMNALRKKADVASIYDGYRRSYATYRYRQLKDLSALAHEMGNSPKELVDSYKRNVTDAEAAAWFGVMPPDGYTEQVEAYLALRNAA